MELFSNIANTHKETYSNINQKDSNHQIKKPEELNTTQKVDKELEKSEKKSEEKLTKDEIQNLTKKLNKEMEPLNPDIKFHYDEKVDSMIVNVIDKNTDKVIRKIPSAEALKIMEKMRELVGALFDKKG